MHFKGGLFAGCEGTHDERGTVERVTADEDVFRILRMFGLEESHSEKTKFGFDDFRFSFFDHYGTTSRIS